MKCGYITNEVIQMDQEELLAIVRSGAVRIRMNDGRVYDVPDMEHIVVSPISAVVLHRNDNGETRNIYLPLVTMSGVEKVNA